jgi:hypothetical protein
MAAADSELGEKLSLALRGSVVTPQSSTYDEARTLFNAMIDRRPAVIAYPVDAADVASAVTFGRDAGLDIAVRCGGHNGPGFGCVDDGLVIDLSAMRGVAVDPDARTARVLGGTLLGQVDAATHEHGLAAPFGIISTTGVGGLTLGGGVGHLTRKLGLSIDNVLSADVVLANGSQVTASEDENPDLFWALRGGGGNFGVVTAFTFRLSPIDTVIAGPMFWPLEQSAEVLSWYAEFMPQQPDDLNGFFAFLAVPPADPFPQELHLQNVCAVVWCYAGVDEEEAAKLLEPARRLGPILDGVGPVPYAALQSVFDGVYPSGDHWYWRAAYLRDIPRPPCRRTSRWGRRRRPGSRRRTSIPWTAPPDASPPTLRRGHTATRSGCRSSWASTRTRSKHGGRRTGRSRTGRPCIRIRWVAAT